MSRRPSAFFLNQEENTAYNILLGSPTRWAMSVGLTILLVLLVFQATVGGQRTKSNSNVSPDLFHTSSKLPIRPLQTAQADQRCQNTQQGREYITDDEGHVCKRRDVDRSTGCCKPKMKADALPQYTCQTCNMTTQCCTHYEFCTSCCMSPSNIHLKMSVVSQNPTMTFLRAETDPFTYCRAVCRTSSKSVFAINRYRNDEKHCFGPEAPPISKEQLELAGMDESAALPPPKEKRSLLVDGPNRDPSPEMEMIKPLDMPKIVEPPSFSSSSATKIMRSSLWTLAAVMLTLQMM